MPTRLLPAAVAGLGLFLVAATGVAIVDRALVPAAVFGIGATAHLGIAAGLAAGYRPAALAGALVGVIDAALVIVGMAFILGIETGIGVDLGSRWFAPLNGYATIAVAAAVGATALALVVRGVAAVRDGFAVPAPRG